MSKRTSEASKRIRLLKLLEENDQKSPDTFTAVVTAWSPMEAYGIAGIFEEAAGEDLPFPLDEWRLTLKHGMPVELYFVFKRKRDLGRFIRKMSQEFPDKEVIT